MKEEFNLSEKIITNKEKAFGYIRVQDVKEFINRLKDDLNTIPKGTIKIKFQIENIIDKLAGSKLK